MSLKCCLKAMESLLKEGAMTFKASQGPLNDPWKSIRGYSKTSQMPVEDPLKAF
jgi:hypothetical protein